MRLFYGSSNRHPAAKGRLYRNPSRFLTPVVGATDVLIDGDWPAVMAAYVKIGVQPVRLAPGQPVPVLPERLALPDGWRSLDWPALRKLHKDLTGRVATNKAGALAGIETHINGGGHG